MPNRKKSINPSFWAATPEGLTDCWFSLLIFFDDF
jgi:hypothetical protein